MMLTYCLLLVAYLMAMRSGGGQTSGGSSDRDDSPTGSPPPPSSSAGHRRSSVGKITQKNFEDSSVVRTLVRDMKDAYCGPYPTWSSFPPELRGQLWERFQSRFSWEDEETDLVRDAWEKANTRRITQTLSTARKAALNSARTDRISMTRGHGPRWMNDTVWEGLILHWSSEDWRTTSAQSSKNRQTEKEGGITKHVGGSISFARHRTIMETELARAPTEIELFQRTHKKKGTVDYVDQRSRVAMERYEAELTQKYGAERATQEQFDRDVWLHATGGKTKGKTYGFGGRSEDFGGASSSGGSTARNGQPSGGQYITAEQMEAYVQQRIKASQDEMYRRGWPLHPPAPDDDEDHDD